jgi:hypothetical protein
MIGFNAPKERFQMLTICYCSRELKHELIIMVTPTNMDAPISCDESYPIG